jgi:hypothetical protein
MLRRVAFLKADVSEELSASIIRVTRISELGTTLVVILHSLRAFEKMMLRRILGQKRDEVTGGWRKPHTEELCDLYSSPSIIRIIK